MLPLEGAGDFWFHIPIRCEKRSIQAGLCELCIARERRTEERVKEAAGGMIKRGLHPGMLHGRVGEPVPSWSRIIGGDWYNLKIEGGCRVSEETMGKARVAIDVAEGVGAQLVPEEGGGGRRGRKPKAAAAVAAVESTKPVQTKLSIEQLRKAAVEAKAVEANVVPAAPPVTVAPTPAAAPVPKKRGPKKAGGAPAPAPTTAVAVATGFVEDTRHSPVEDVVTIAVRRLELDGGRSYYLDPKKQKVYDMKYKYVGRYSTEKGEIDRGFPDSDAEH
jgi:hypothetical protein